MFSGTRVARLAARSARSGTLNAPQRTRLPLCSSSLVSVRVHRKYASHPPAALSADDFAGAGVQEDSPAIPTQDQKVPPSNGPSSNPEHDTAYPGFRKIGGVESQRDVKWTLKGRAIGNVKAKQGPHSDSSSPEGRGGLPLNLRTEISRTMAEDIHEGKDDRFEDVKYDSKGVMVPPRLNTKKIHGAKHEQRYTHTWLRDSCRCSQCVNQETMQRNFNIFDSIPDLAKLEPLEVKAETEGLRIIWNHEKHESFYPWSFFDQYQEYGMRTLPDFKSLRKHWGSEIAHDPPTVKYEEVMDTASESGMAKLTDHLIRYGLVFVDGTPFDDAIHTKRLLERIGPIRETHYGGFYDFVPDMAKADTAYTNIALPAHTDTTYFTDPAGLQAFHILSHTPPPDAPEGTPASGGKSLLVDGFRAADLLREENITSFLFLQWHRIPWHASGNQGVTITSKEGQGHAVIQTEETGRTRAPAALKQIRWNNDDRGVLPIWGPRGVTPMEWYKAAAKWNEILKRESSEFWFQLTPGRTLIFDNHRVLHGRSAFTGMRRVCGAYINHDDFMSRWRNTNLPREEVLAQVIG